jgi:hypothetical protein
MRPTPNPTRGGDAVDALVTDRYLDALRAGVAPGAPAAAHARPGDGPAGDGTPGAQMHPTGEDAPAPEIRHAGGVVRAALVRVHPSFRFEERLADRLAQLAAGASLAVAAGRGSAEVIPFPASGPGADDPLLAAVIDGRLDPADPDAVARAAGIRSPARPLIVGGAITSAALSLVGVAWVAWRASRPGGPVMSRSARAADARRLAELAAGLPVGPA